MTSTRFAIVLSWVLGLSLMAGLAADFDIHVVDRQGKQQDLPSVIADIDTARVVFIGENHARYDQHLSELEIIRRLYEREPDRWAIGVEFIQRPFQKDLDDYIAGRTDEREFLEKTEYFDRWGFDFRLYRPIFQFAKEHAIPMVALNAERELTEKVGKAGLEGLTSQERQQLPVEIDKSDQSYRKRIEKIFKDHSVVMKGTFEHFWEAQLVWDETMAASVAEYLMNHPERAVIVLAGAGHIESGSGIPNRVSRRLPQLKTTSLIAADNASTKSNPADYCLISNPQTLPPAPKMGIVMEMNDGVRVKNVTAGGPAAAVGVKLSDRLVAIDGQTVKSIGDVRLALLNKTAGDRIMLRIQRHDETRTDDLTIEIVLQ